MAALVHRGEQEAHEEAVQNGRRHGPPGAERPINEGAGGDQQCRMAGKIGQGVAIRPFDERLQFLARQDLVATMGNRRIDTFRHLVYSAGWLGTTALSAAGRHFAAITYIENVTAYI